jgi:hypothetical protein
MAISEIEKLERRFAENPQGLTFAPLAEIHRKNGDVAKALELLGPGLALHPDYIPASIVLGRCHLDLGDQHAAEAAFTHVLSLDGENVIALKALAEITERLLRLDESERWLHTLLSVDRSNDEARDQLERVQASRRQAETGSSASPGADQATTPPSGPVEEPPFEPLETESFVSDSVAPAESASPPPPPLADFPGEPGMAWVSESDAPSSEEAVPLAFEDLSPESPADFVEEVEPLIGLVGRDEEDVVAEPLADVEPFEGRDAGGFEHTGDFQVEMSEDIVLESSGASEFQMPNAAEELYGFSPPPPSAPPAPEPSSEPMAESAAEPVAEAVPEPIVEAVPEPFVEPLPEPVAEVEPEPVAQSAPEPGPSMAPEPISEAAAPPVTLPPPAAIPRRQFAAADAGGRSTQDFFRRMLASRPPVAVPHTARPESAGSASDAGGAPTRPAHDTLSLSSVFGEESTPTRPAVPAAGPAGAGTGGVSYDEFFNSPAQGGSQRPSRSPDPKSDDLDQFHTWLQNLKR